MPGPVEEAQATASIYAAAQVAAGVGGGGAAAVVANRGVIDSGTTANTSAQLVAALSTRLVLQIVNDSDRTLYLRFGSSAVSATDYDDFVPPGMRWENDAWKGEVRRIFPTTIVTGRIRWAELTA